MSDGMHDPFWIRNRRKGHIPDTPSFRKGGYLGTGPVRAASESRDDAPEPVGLRSLVYGVLHQTAGKAPPKGIATSLVAWHKILEAATDEILAGFTDAPTDQTELRNWEGLFKLATRDVDALRLERQQLREALEEIKELTTPWPSRFTTKAKRVTRILAALTSTPEGADDE